MILKMISQIQMSKEERNKFIPFVNERNHKGQIIKNKQKDKQFLKCLVVLQNIKKTTKQYLFDKKYQKMKQKLCRSQLYFQPKQPNYDNQIDNCFKILQKNPRLNPNNINIYDNNPFYVDLNEKISENISTLKSEIREKKKARGLSSKKSIKKFRKLYYDEQNKTQSDNICNSLIRKLKSNNENNQMSTDKCRTQAAINQNENHNQTQSPIFGLRKRQIFREISKQSEKMVDFTNFGMKYRRFVQTEKKDPWKKWYADQKVEIFPGEIVKVKNLQKSIYG